MHTQKLVNFTLPLKRFAITVQYPCQLPGVKLVMDDFKISKLDRFRFDFLKKI